MCIGLSRLKSTFSDVHIVFVLTLVEHFDTDYFYGWIPEPNIVVNSPFGWVVSVGGVTNYQGKETDKASWMVALF